MIDVGGVLKQLMDLSNKYATSATMIQQMDPKAMSTLTKQTSVEPFCVISKDCVNLEYITDVNTTLLNMFIAYYLQAVTSLINVRDIRTNKILRALSTDVSFSLESHSLSEDLLKFKLPTKTNLSLENNNYTQLGEEMPDLQASANLAVGKIIEIEIVLPEQHVYMNKTKSGKESEISYGGSQTFKSNNEHEESSGQIDNQRTSSIKNKETEGFDKQNMYNERDKETSGTEQQIVTNQGRTVVIPILVKLLVNIVSTRVLESLLVRHKEDTGITERWHSWRSGRISFWRDLVMCQDLIKERKKNSLTDETGIIRSIDSRVTNAIIKKSASITTKSLIGKDVGELDAMSLGVASNLYVITAAEALKIEFYLKGKLSSESVRNKLFGNGYAMILCVVDPDRERVKFYVNGASGYTDLSVREIKSVSKNKGPDITDMLKMLQMGMSPTF